MELDVECQNFREEANWEMGEKVDRESRMKLASKCNEKVRKV